MAIPVELTVTVRDGKGESSTFGIFLPSGTSVAGAQAFWDALDQDLYAMIAGEVVSVNVSFPLTLDAALIASNIASATSDVQEKAYFAFTSAEGYLKSLTVPAVVETIFQAGSKLVDLLDTGVAALVTAMVSGAGGVSPVTGHDEDINTFVQGREAWGKYRP